MSFLQGADVIIAWIFILGILCYWAYAEGFFDGILNINMNKETDEEE